MIIIIDIRFAKSRHFVSSALQFLSGIAGAFQQKCHVQTDKDSRHLQPNIYDAERARRWKRSSSLVCCGLG
jgi:hypothetical protein